MKTTHHLTLLYLGYVLFKGKLPFSFDTSLLPDWVLCKELVCGTESRIMKHVWIAFQHISNSGT